MAPEQSSISLPYVPFDRQRLAHAAPERHVLFGGAVGGGKSATLVNDALYQCLGWSGNRVGIFRWEYSTFKKTTYVEMEKFILSVPNLVRQHNQQDHFIELLNGSRIVYGGLKPSSSASGDLFSIVKSLALSSVYVDEVSDVPEKLFDFLCTRVGRHRARNARSGKTENPPARVVCTCNPHIGWAKGRWIDSDRPGYRFVPSRVYDTIEAGHLPESYADDLKAAWKDNPEWAEQLLEGNWDAVEDFAAICPQSAISEAIARNLAPGTTAVLGIDVGAWGDDSTVMVLRRGRKFEVLLERSQQSTMDTVNQAAMFADRHDVETIKIDSVGVGQGPSDRLEEMGYPVDPVVSGERAGDPRYANRRTEMWWQFRKALMDGEMDLPDHPKLVNELGSVRYVRSASDRTVAVESKKELKKRLGHSPDFADATVYASEGMIEYYPMGMAV